MIMAATSPTSFATMQFAVPSPISLPRVGTLRAPVPSTPTTYTTTTPGLIYQPKSGLVQGSIPGGGLIPIPVPGQTIPEEAPPEEEGLGDKIMTWWSRMPLSQKALTAGAAVAGIYGIYWFATRKKGP